MSALMPLAVFDFDGTLCPGDSIVSFLSFCIQEKLAKPSQLLKAGKGFFLQKTGRITPSYAKALTLSFLADHSVAEIRPYAQRFVRDVLKPRIYPDAQKWLDKLHTEGYHIMVVSASTDIYMQFLPEILPVDTVLSTVYEIQEGHLYTGRVLSNCRDQEKAVRIQAWYANHPQFAWPPALACGDSYHDIDMLHLSPHPVLVHPDAALQDAFPGAECLNWKRKASPSFLHMFR